MRIVNIQKENPGELNLKTMAKVAPIIPMSNSLGDFSLYRLRGEEKLIMRAKGGASKAQIASSPAFARLRLRQSEFKGSGKGAGFIMRTFWSWKDLADYNIAGSLNKICNIIQTRDVVNPLGTRSVKFTEHGRLLEGFNLNRKHPFDSLITQSPTHSFIKSECKAILSYPELNPLVNLFNPWNIAYFRIVIGLGIIPDLVFKGKTYEPANPSQIFNPARVVTEWIASSATTPPQTKEISLDPSLFVDDTSSLLLSVGIEFGRPLSGSLIETVKYSGSAKILGVATR